MLVLTFCRRLTALAILCGVAACSDQATGAGGFAPPTISQSGKHLTSCPCLYVPNFFGDSITVYKAGAHGNRAPIQNISGTYTDLRGPQAVAVDASANIYVTNEDGNIITIYHAGATGNIPPSRYISGNSTQLRSPYGIAVNPVNGNIYVVNYMQAAIWIFSAASNGNAAPTASIQGSKTGLLEPLGLAFDSAGNLFVADYQSNAVLMYSAGSTGNVAPARTIQSDVLVSPTQVALDSRNTSTFLAICTADSFSCLLRARTATPLPFKTSPGQKQR
jgi:DNA-binding beta-propeller fold protein YncE